MGMKVYLLDNGTLLMDKSLYHLESRPGDRSSGSRSTRSTSIILRPR